MLRRGPVLTAIILAALTHGSTGDALADRYRNETGLYPGRFVWSPTVAPEGPVTIVATPAAGTLHVFRDGIEIGITTIAIEPATEGSGPAGIYTVSALEQATGGPSKRMTWRGAELLVHEPSRGSDQKPLQLPDDFAGLLLAASHRGSVVVLAQERSGPQQFSAPGPFVDPIETGSVNRVGRFASPELSMSPQPQEPARRSSAPAPHMSEHAGAVTSLVLSRADLSAYVMKDGRLVDRLPIAVDEPTRAFGTHVAVLLAPGTDSREARWLAFGLDQDGSAAHVVAEQAEAVMRRVRFLDRGRTATLAADLEPGVTVVLMDGHGPSATAVPRFDVELLTNAAAGVSQTAPAALLPRHDPGAPERASAAGVAPKASALRLRRSSATAAADAAPQRRRARRGPLDHREDWPNSLYWPY